MGKFPVLRALLLLSLAVIIHEGGHGIAAALLGHVPTKVTFGWGPQVVSFTAWGVSFGAAPFPFGGYTAVEPFGDPRDALVALAGPVVGLVPVLFHPQARRAIAFVAFVAWALLRWFVTGKGNTEHGERIRAVGKALSKSDVERPEVVAPTRWWHHLPFLGDAHAAQRAGFAQLSLVLSVFNLFPVPPADGARVILAFLPQTTPVKLAYAMVALCVVTYFFLFLPMRGIVRHMRSVVRPDKG